MVVFVKLAWVVEQLESVAKLVGFSQGLLL